MLIRTYRDDDVDRALMLIKANSEVQVEDLEKKVGEGQRVVAVQAGEIVGFSQLVTGNPGRYTFRTFVKPCYRRQGIAKAMWQHLKATLPLDTTVVYSSLLKGQDETRAFIHSIGFTHWYSMNLMYYTGPGFSPSGLTVRPYGDCYYGTFLKLINEGFYQIRKDHDFKPYQIYADDAITNPQTRQEVLEMEYDEHLLFFDGAELVGLAQLINSEIDTVTVLRALQGRGYGRCIMEYCVNLLLSRGHNPVVLHVLDSNPVAKRLYEKIGFNLVETREMYRLNACLANRSLID